MTAWTRAGAGYNPGDVVRLEQFGGSPAASGALNSTALSSAWNALLAAKGGVIELPAGDISLANTVLPDATKRIAIRGAGPRLGTTLVPTEEDGAGAPTSWLLAIGDGTEVQFVELSDFCIQGDKDNKTNINGIKVARSNVGVFRRVLARHLIGTGLHFIRPHNSEFNGLTTAHCGSLSHDKFAQVYTGDDVSNSTGNDLRFIGKNTTEEDELGIQMSFLGNVFGGHIKLHGSDSSRRALEMIRVNNFDLTVIPSQGYTGDGMIYVGDSGAVDPPPSSRVPTAPGSAGPVSVGRLNIVPHRLLTNHGAAGAPNNAVLEIDCDSWPSFVAVEGMMPELAVADSKYVHLTATTGTTARIDLSRLATSESDEDQWILDERTNTKALSVDSIGRLAGVQLGLRDTWPGLQAYHQAPSETALYKVPASSDHPEQRLIGSLFENTSRGTVFRGSEHMVFNYPLTLSATAWVVPPFHFPFFTDAGGNAAIARIRRVSIGAIGLGAWDGANHWLLRLYRHNATEDFFLSTDESFASGTGGAGHPDRTMPVGTHYCLDYWNTPTAAGVRDHGAANVRFEAVKVGAPSDLTGLQITVYYDLVL